MKKLKPIILLSLLPYALHVSHAAEMDPVSAARLNSYINSQIIDAHSSRNLDSTYRFDPDTKSWTSYLSYIGGIKDKFSQMTSEDWESFDFKGENAQEALDYLSALGNGKISSDNLTASEALSILQGLFNDFCHEHTPKWNGYLPCEGLSFKAYIGYCDLTCLSGVTGTQLAGASCLVDTIFPAVRFNGTEDFAGKGILYGSDLSRCSGFTAQQLLQFNDIRRTILPEIVFRGNENFTGKQITDADFSRCVGLTAEQILTGDTLSGVKLPAIAFSGSEDLSGKSLKGADLTKCTGITLAQIKASSDIEGLKWPNITLKPGETLAGVKCWNSDFSACTNITGEQLMASPNLMYAKFPPITFTGSENFSGKNLGNVDIRNTKGITAEQLASAFTVNGLRITSAQFKEYEAMLREKKATVYVDGVYTKLG